MLFSEVTVVFVCLHTGYILLLGILPVMRFQEGRVDQEWEDGISLH